MKIGYIRVSTREQNIARQEVLMERLGVDRIYIDRVSGKNAERPRLLEMLSDLRPGDMVVVEAISRFARNTKDLLNLVDQLSEREVEFVSQKEKMDTTTPAGRFMLTVFGACAELERAYILDRQREGIEIRKAAGGYSGENHKGKPRIQVDKRRFERLAKQVDNGELNQRDAAKQLGISYSTFYRRYQEWKEQAA